MSRPVVRDGVRDLSPGYFALVMATGIISIGLHDLDHHLLSLVLFAITVAAYIMLCVWTAWRAIAYRSGLLRDARAPETAFAFFSIVAATNVLAVRLIQSELMGIAIPLVLFAAVLWFVFGYILPWQVLKIRGGKPILANTNGTWFLWAVASQSLSISLTQVQPHLHPAERWVGLLAVLSWSVGFVIYAVVAILALLRIIQYGITPQELDPPYWIAMGALAIAVVAGSSIVGMEPDPAVEATRTLIASTVVVFWSFCVWLIPLLLGIGVWRHALRRVPLQYTPALWSMVFPMGMFSVASLEVGRVGHLPIAVTIGHVGMFIALGVWAVVFIAMLWHLARSFTSTRDYAARQPAHP